MVRWVAAASLVACLVAACATSSSTTRADPTLRPGELRIADRHFAEVVVDRPPAGWELVPTRPGDYEGLTPPVCVDVVETSCRRVVGGTLLSFQRADGQRVARIEAGLGAAMCNDDGFKWTATTVRGRAARYGTWDGEQDDMCESNVLEWHEAGLVLAVRSPSRELTAQIAAGIRIVRPSSSRLAVHIGDGSVKDYGRQQYAIAWLDGDRPCVALVPLGWCDTVLQPGKSLDVSPLLVLFDERGTTGFAAGGVVAANVDHVRIGMIAGAPTTLPTVSFANLRDARFWFLATDVHTAPISVTALVDRRTVETEAITLPDRPQRVPAVSSRLIARGLTAGRLWTIELAANGELDYSDQSGGIGSCVGPSERLHVIEDPGGHLTPGLVGIARAPVTRVTADGRAVVLIGTAAGVRAFVVSARPAALDAYDGDGRVIGRWRTTDPSVDHPCTS